jgi:hypothetical protein
MQKVTGAGSIAGYEFGTGSPGKVDGRIDPQSGPCRVAVHSILPADSPRLGGEDPAHIARLAEEESSLPPILVHRSTMRVVDGMHRLRAAMARGWETIEVEYFEGTDEEAFERAVRANVTHGLPLTKADAREAGISPTTVRDVRRRLCDGDDPVPASAYGTRRSHQDDANGSGPASRAGAQTPAGKPDPSTMLQKLMRDPSLRQSGRGRQLLRWLQEPAPAPAPVSAGSTSSAIPPASGIPTCARISWSSSVATSPRAWTS